MSKCADKYTVRNYIKETIGEQHLIPLIGIYDSVEEINFNQLPDKSILKPTHCSGRFIIGVREKESSELKLSTMNLDLITQKEATALLRDWLSIDYYSLGGEWCYKNIEPRIICEHLITDEHGDLPWDYKLFCFNGVPQLIQVDLNRTTYHTRLLYDTNWTPQNFTLRYPKHSIEISPPPNLDILLKVAKALSKEFKFVRVDLYAVKDKIYVGELTFYPGNGFEKFDPEEHDQIIGSYLNLKGAKS